MKYVIGDLVVVNFGQYKNQYALVYDVYQDFDDNSKIGVCIITKDGDDIGGFSAKETKEHIQLCRHTDFYYSFVSVLRLDDDYHRGVFDYPFSLIK